MKLTEEEKTIINNVIDKSSKLYYKTLEEFVCLFSKQELVNFVKTTKDLIERQE